MGNILGLSENILKKKQGKKISATVWGAQD
jgi:hypothetical protein